MLHIHVGHYQNFKKELSSFVATFLFSKINFNGKTREIPESQWM